MQQGEAGTGLPQGWDDMTGFMQQGEACNRLFVYGTLRRGFPSRWSRLLWSQADHAGDGCLPGVLYDLGPYPAFVDPGGDGESVHGEVAVLRDPALLAQLDLYEGSQYERVLRSVQMQDGARLEAWVYRFRAPLGRARRLPGGRWPVE